MRARASRLDGLALAPDDAGRSSAAIAAVFARHGGWWWDGSGENPYVALLAHADAIVTTADSTNMIGEATATGAPILVFEPHGGHGKLAKFLEALKRQGMVHHFEGTAGKGERATNRIDSTQAIAEASCANAGLCTGFSSSASPDTHLEAVAACSPRLRARMSEGEEEEPIMAHTHATPK